MFLKTFLTYVVIFIMAWINVVFLAMAWNRLIANLAKYEVEYTNRQYQEAIEREVGK